MWRDRKRIDELTRQVQDNKANIDLIHNSDKKRNAVLISLVVAAIPSVIGWFLSGITISRVRVSPSVYPDHALFIEIQERSFNVTDLFN